MWTNWYRERAQWNIWFSLGQTPPLHVETDWISTLWDYFLQPGGLSLSL